MLMKAPLDCDSNRIENENILSFFFLLVFKDNKDDDEEK